MAGRSAMFRLLNELKDLEKNEIPLCSAKPASDSNLFLWNATIKGPEGSPYANQSFELSITFPQDYPFTPPTIRFITKIDHVYVSKDGLICIDILNDQWSPAQTLRTILLSIVSLLADEVEIDSDSDSDWETDEDTDEEDDFYADLEQIMAVPDPVD